MNDPEEFDVFDRKRQAPKLAERLLDEPCLVPLGPDAEDQRRYSDYDLASSIDYRCGEAVDPDDLRDPKVREHWVKRALDDGEHLGHHFDFGRRPFWIVDHGERIGTMGFCVRDNVTTDLDYSSVYVRPQHRRQGWGSRILQRVKDAAFDLDIQRVLISCDWGNGRALRFYLAQGMWVQSWKHSIRLFITKGEPRWRMETDGARATFLVEDRVVGVAENRGDRLGWQLGDNVDKDLKWNIEATAPVALALMGWPIIRNDEAWESQIRSGFSDCGDFEGLAFRIRQFERYLRRQGWIVPPPNPSFATLPKFIGVEQRTDGLHASVSNGASYPLPYELLDPMPSHRDPVVNVVVACDDEIMFRLRSGEIGFVSVDRVLSLNQSPEHLQEMVEFWRRHER